MTGQGLLRGCGPSALLAAIVVEAVRDAQRRRSDRADEAREWLRDVGVQVLDDLGYPDPVQALRELALV